MLARSRSTRGKWGAAPGPAASAGRPPAGSVPPLVPLASANPSARVGLKILTQEIGTAPTAGRLVFTILAAVAEMERELIRDGVRAGMERTHPGTTATAQSVDGSSTVGSCGSSSGTDSFTVQGWKSSAPTWTVDVGSGTTLL